MLYIIDYTNGIPTKHGPFKSAHVLAIHTTVPKIEDDRISFSVTDTDDIASVLTVSMVHTITSNPTEEENT